jgi:hypothetical protein
MGRTRTIKASELFDPITIDLFGTRFALRIPTRSSEEAMSELETKLDEAQAQVQEESLDEKAAREILMPIFYEMFDLMLEPNTDSEKKLPAKKRIKELYDKDKMGLTGIRALINEIANVRAEERRPT